VTCIDPGCPIDTYVNHRSKSTIASTFWVALPLLPMYIIWSCEGGYAVAWVLSIAPMQSLEKHHLTILGNFRACGTKVWINLPYIVLTHTHHTMQYLLKFYANGLSWMIKNMLCTTIRLIMTTCNQDGKRLHWIDMKKKILAHGCSLGNRAICRKQMYPSATSCGFPSPKHIHFALWSLPHSCQYKLWDNIFHVQKSCTIYYSKQPTLVQ
jgi:hypothetical protein